MDGGRLDADPRLRRRLLIGDKLGSARGDRLDDVRGEFDSERTGLLGGCGRLWVIWLWGHGEDVSLRPFLTPICGLTRCSGGMARRLDRRTRRKDELADAVNKASGVELLHHVLSPCAARLVSRPCLSARLERPIEFGQVHRPAWS